MKLSPRPAVADAQAKRIKALIADFAKLDNPDFGLPDSHGYSFAPIEKLTTETTGVSIEHQFGHSKTLKALVALGPDALPFLLDSLDDKTPTRIVIEQHPFGHMWHDVFFNSINPANPAEATVYRAYLWIGRDENQKRKDLTSYTVTVGDVCFVAIGQIVGRDYQSVGYGIGPDIHINSPTHDSKLRADVQRIWTSKDPAKKLFESLLADYATAAIPDGTEFPEGSHLASSLQCRAALRLLYYFPKESTTLIADRLEKFHIAGTIGLAGEEDEREVQDTAANGVFTDDFIEAVSWCKEPAIRSALISIFKKATQRRILLATLDAVEDKNLIRDRLEPLLDTLVPQDDWGFGFSYRLLEALGKRTPDTAKSSFRHYLRVAKPNRCAIICELLFQLDLPWDTELLEPLLIDTREVSQAILSDKQKQERASPFRVCDEAATALAQRYKRIKFSSTSPIENRDKQITAIRTQLILSKLRW